MRRILVDGNPRIYDLLDRKATVKLIEQHLRGDRNRRLLIWSLLNVTIALEQTGA